jgi:S-adenosylmethionine decarboxylase
MKIELQGFNNLTKAVSVNLYEFRVAATPEERQQYISDLNSKYSASEVTSVLENIVEIIDAQVLSISQQDYHPWGASSMVLMSDGPLTPSVSAHVDKSHVCAHTYPDLESTEGICSFRIDIDISTCGTISPLRGLNYLMSKFNADVATVDYVVRGYTRDQGGRKIYMDHTIRSITDFIRIDLLEEYHVRDVMLSHERIWQTHMMKNITDPQRYFYGPVREDMLLPLRKEMQEVFYGMDDSLRKGV